MKLSRCQVISVSLALAVSCLVIVGIVIGSGGFERFDTPLVPYAIATVFAAFGLVYRYSMWVQRPPTYRYFVCSWRIFLRPQVLVRNVVHLIGVILQNIVAQKFIEKRSPTRWIAHLLIAWGCLLAFAITFPLSWGWVQFGSSSDGANYVVEFMGMRQFEFNPHSIVGFMFFNGLNISAAMILTGIAFAMHRRLFDRGAQAVQSLSSDFMALFLLFTVSVTGLMLTASQKLMVGANYSFLSLIHAFAVIMFLLYLPFGKLFHIIQRTAQLGVIYYKEEGEKGAQAMCMRSGEPYQSRMHHDDLVAVMSEVGMDFGDHQNLSPLEKRKLIALNQATYLPDRPYLG